MQVLIYRAVSADAAGMLEHLKLVGGETENLSFGAEGLNISVEAERAYIAQNENSCDSIMLVAKVDGKIVGSGSLNRLPRRMHHRGEISVAVAKEYWNKGIGSQLLCKLIDFAKDNAFEIIELQVRSDNLHAIRLYEKFGFKRICTYPGFFKIEDRLIDFDYMCLYL